MLRNAILADLDGTLSDPSKRLHYIQGQKKDYDSFYKEVYFDEPTAVVNLLREYAKKGETSLICVTGRPDSCRQDTINWLNLHGIFPDALYMRPNGDFREDSIIKKELLHYLRVEFNPILVIDDRPSVVAMWKAEGLPVVHIHRDDWYEKGKNYAPEGATMLYLMVGPSGGGKSTWISMRNFAPLVSLTSELKILSSDDLRKTLCGDFRDQTKNDQVFDLMRSLAKDYMRCGVPIVWDATNIRRKDRVSAAKLVPNGTRCCYIVCDRPLVDKHRDAGWRSNVHVDNLSLIDKHHHIFQSNLRGILVGDGLDFVDVKDYRNSKG